MGIVDSSSNSNNDTLSTHFTDFTSSTAEKVQGMDKMVVERADLFRAGYSPTFTVDCFFLMVLCRNRRTLMLKAFVFI